MHFSARLVLVVVIYSPRNTEGGSRTARVSAGHANTQNVICTSSKAVDVEVYHRVVMLTTHAIDIRRDSTSMRMTSLCVKMQCVCGALDFSIITYRCAPLVSPDRVREITSILCTLFPMARL